MMQRFLLLGILWLLVGCSAGSTPAPVETSFPENTTAPSQQPRPYVTPRRSWTPSITVIPTITVPYQSGLLLRDGILTIDDLPQDAYSELELFLEYLGGSVPNGPPATILDMSGDMIQAGECPFDCVKQNWRKLNYQMVIWLSRMSSAEQAEQAVSDLRLDLLEQDGLLESEDQSQYLGYCWQGLPENSWVVWVWHGIDGNCNYYLGASRGPIMLALAGDVSGDDVPHYACILTEFARLQFDKLYNLGYFP